MRSPVINFLLEKSGGPEQTIYFCYPFFCGELFRRNRWRSEKFFSLSPEKEFFRSFPRKNFPEEPGKVGAGGGAAFPWRPFGTNESGSVIERVRDRRGEQRHSQPGRCAGDVPLSPASATSDDWRVTAQIELAESSIGFFGSFFLPSRTPPPKSCEHIFFLLLSFGFPRSHRASAVYLGAMRRSPDAPRRRQAPPISIDILLEYWISGIRCWPASNRSPTLNLPASARDTRENSERVKTSPILNDSSGTLSAQYVIAFWFADRLALGLSENRVAPLFPREASLGDWFIAPLSGRPPLFSQHPLCFYPFPPRISSSPFHPSRLFSSCGKYRRFFISFLTFSFPYANLNLLRLRTQEIVWSVWISTAGRRFACRMGNVTVRSK